MTSPADPLTRFLPMTRAEMEARGWDAVDIVFVTGDAYIDHYSFAAAILGRALEAAGFRVALLSQPDWKSAEPWRRFGRPRLFFAVSAGNMDSMINHYTASRKVRNDDAYSPGGRIGLRPDRATIPYCQRAREAYPGVPVVAGGVEASLRRLAHYDYWSDGVRPSILLDAKADLVGYGSGEETIVAIAQRLRSGGTIKDCRALRGVAYATGASEPVPSGEGVVELPSFERVKESKDAFLEMARIAHRESSQFNASTLLQRHGARTVVVTPPPLPLPQDKMDFYYGLPYTRRAHPSYREPIPAFETIKDSVTIMRGCFGGCTFCSITAHQGRTIQSRSEESVLAELTAMGKDPDFKGVVSDIGGPTANMYKMRCTKPEVEKICRRASCVHPTVCQLLGTDHAPLVKLMKRARAVPGVKKVFVASGIRMDLARLSPEYMSELTAHHVGGRLKVAPEHVSPRVLATMKKPRHHTFEDFAEKFAAESRKAGKPQQQLVPYFIAAHPGSGLTEMIELAAFLKKTGHRPDQVQDFIPTPHDLATAMYYTGRDPETGAELPVARGLRDRRLQKALLQFFKPENWFDVREALLKAGRKDLIGRGPGALIPPEPPPEAFAARRERAEKGLTRKEAPPSSPKKGYRPGRAGWRRREK